MLALAVALPGLAVVLAAAPVSAAPAGCDANHDGNPTGTTADVFTNGADDAAARLAAETGLTLAQAQAAHRWRVPVCVETVDDANPATVDRFVVVVGSPVDELRPEAAQWERSALDNAVGDLTPRLFRPGARTSPHVAGVQVIGIEMWLAIDPAAWVPFTATATAGEVSVTATATPSKMVWEFTDGVTKICDGPGVQYTPGAPGPAPCGRSFDHTTALAPVTAAVSIEYTIAWSSTLANRGTLTKRGEANRYELVVGEVQTYLSDGERGDAPSAADLPDPASSQPINDSHCSLSNPLDCSPADIAHAITGLAADVLWNTLPQPVKDALTKLWDFMKGCASVAGDMIGSVKETFAQFGQLLSDPQGFVHDKLDVATAMYEAVKTDPKAFAGDLLGNAVEYELLQANPVQWAGKMGCQLALVVLTGGEALQARFADVLGDINTFVDKVHDWLRKRDHDLPGVHCKVSSFPTGTEVLLADGSHRPIDAIRPGDTVWAFDPVDGSWQPRPVLAQWSHLDTDEMATLRLADGATVSATDHHEFWSASRGTFDELEDLTTGERLATPQGQVLVDSVTVWPSAPTLVWELTVAVDHTFAVFAGDHAIAVHNEQCGIPDGMAHGPGEDRGDGRDDQGKFTGDGGYGKRAEAAALADYAAAQGVDVITRQVRVKLPDGSTRYYDGLVRRADGTYEGIEVKSGGASLEPGQRTFDDEVSSGSVATGTLDGTQIKVTSVRLIRVP